MILFFFLLVSWSINSLNSLGEFTGKKVNVVVHTFKKLTAFISQLCGAHRIGPEQGIVWQVPHQSIPIFFMSSLYIFTHILIQILNFFFYVYTHVCIFTRILIRRHIFFCNLYMCLYFYSYIIKRAYLFYLHMSIF